MSKYALINAGPRRQGNVIYDSYEGQIKPADLGKVLWWHPSANPIGATGTVARPFQTKEAAIAAWTDSYEYILDMSFGGRYLGSEAPFFSNGNIYVDLISGNDANTGLDPANAKLTWASARLAVIGGSKTISVIGDGALTDLIDWPTQGAIGYTLNINREPTFHSDPVASHLQNAAWSGTVFGNGLYVRTHGTVSNSVIYTSPDGYTWTLRANPWNAGVTGSARSIAYGTPGGLPLYVICGVTTAAYNNLVLTSPDGINWTARTTTTNGSRVVWVQSLGLFVLVGKNRGGGAANRIMTSPDGITWTLRVSSWPDVNSVYNGLETDGTQIVATGHNSAGLDTDGQMETSIDGITWTTRLTGVPRLWEVRHNAGQWIVISEKALTIGSNFYETLTPQVTASWVKDTQDLTGTLRPRALSLAYSRVWGWIAVSNVGGFFIQRKSTGNTAFLSDVGDGNTGYPGGFANPLFTTNAQHVIAYIHAPSNREYIFVSVDNSGNGDAPPEPTISRAWLVYPEPANIRANITNAVINTAYPLAVSRNINIPISSPKTEVDSWADHITAEPLSGSAMQTFNVQSYNCKIKSVTSPGYTFYRSKLIENLIEGVGALTQNGFAAIVGDIEVLKNTFAFTTYQLNNLGGLNLERYRDNIIEAAFSAVAQTTMESGNIRGALSNVFLQPNVSQIDPLFIDLVKYRLQRELLAFAFDSFMVARSTFYLNIIPFKRDLGATSGAEINVVYVYDRSFRFLLPSKADAVSHIKHNRSNLHVSENGTPDVVNTPTGRWEELLFNCGALPQFAENMENHIEFIDYIESLIDMTCQIKIDVDFIPAPNITTTAVAATDDVFLDIAFSNIRSGDRITIGAYEYSVIYVVNQTRIVLGMPLKQNVPAATVIPVASPPGYGEYKYVPQQERRLTRWLWDRADYLHGVVMRFARKWQ